MRYLFILLMIGVGAALPVAPTQAQGNDGVARVALQWGGYANLPAQPNEVGPPRGVPTFGGAQWASRRGESQLYTVRIEGAVASGELQNLVWAPFAPADARLLENRTLAAGPAPRLSTSDERKRPVTLLTLDPVRRNPGTGQPERLVSFEYRYQLAPAVARRGGSSTRSHAAHSVLAQGDWFKVGVAESGIYKLDKAALRALGVPVATADPRRIQLYGNSMGVLPQPNAAYRPDDLMENNILFVGNADAAFDDNEYFLFYSPGAHTWAARGGLFRHRNNYYTDTTYYFVTVGNTLGRRVSPVAPPAATGAEATITTFDERRFYEHDLVSILKSGREWLGEAFNAGGPSKEFVFGGLDNLVPGAPLRLTVSVASGSAAAGSFTTMLNGSALGTQNLQARPSATSPYSADVSLNTTTLQSAVAANPGPELRVALSYASPGDATAFGYLDYLVLNVPRQLRMSGPAMEFRSLANIAPNAQNRYVLANAGTAQVWDVTNPRRPVAQTLDANGSFLAAADTLREFVAVQPGTGFPVPRAFGRVPNQDLHALDGSLDLVIVTYPPFKPQAERLANHRRTHDNLRVAVVTTSEVYNEYGSGGQDVTAIRDLMKQVYDRAPAGKEQFLLLFGDASFDYKSDPFNDRAQEPAWWSQRKPFRNDADFDRANQNYVPTYESRESYSPFYGASPSYSSEDYYALLSDDEGEWPETSVTPDALDIGVGRLPVRTPKGDPRSTVQAQQMVDKLIAYDAPAAYGKWRNRITLAADDSDNNYYSGFSSSTGSEGIASRILTEHPEYNINKAYLDLYPQISVAAGQRSPECNRAVDEAFERGSLLWNYLGHGGPKGLADEQILTNASVLALRNLQNMPFMVTGTCDLSTYDNPEITSSGASAGEEVLVDNYQGGAVGLFTTTRVVDAGANDFLVSSFFRLALAPLADGTMPRIGDVVARSKNLSSTALNNRNYTVLGDPSMRLAYPEQRMVLDSVNGKLLTAALNDTLQALSRVRLSGHVQTNGALSSGFNGTAQVTVFDKPATVTTLGDEDGSPMPVPVQVNVVHNGQARVSSGRFMLRFVVPKDINYSVGMGKISLYAFDPTGRHDANGQQQMRVGGASRDTLRDTTPPAIALHMDNYEFYSGGTTGQNTKLLARLQDESGINTTGAGIGHDITAVLDNDPNKTVVLNDAYVSEVGDFRSGKLQNLFKELPTGPHSIRLKAWDTYNNSGESTIEFIVARTEQLVLNHVLNYPNPFAGTTHFSFDHNRRGEELDVQVQVFTVAGRLVRTLRATVTDSTPQNDRLAWNGRDDYNDPLARGVYVYRISVRSPRDGSTASKFEKLVILN